jgi:hypothetical protein
MTNGQRYSQIYLKEEIPQEDSMRMRNRIATYFEAHLIQPNEQIARAVRMTTGAVVHRYFPTFIRESELRDFLDTITIIFNFLTSPDMFRSDFRAANWHTFVSTVFTEEHLSYRLDKEGVVHYHPDEEYERSRMATVAGLASQPAVLEAFEKSYSFLDLEAPDTSSSIRAIFESLEILYKHITNSEGRERLNSHGIQSKIKPLIQNGLSENPTELKATDHMLDGVCDWIEAGHMYRHGQKVDETEAPSLEYTIMYISQGASYLRFLAPLTQAD